MAARQPDGRERLVVVPRHTLADAQSTCMRIARPYLDPETYPYTVLVCLTGRDGPSSFHCGWPPGIGGAGSTASVSTRPNIP